MVADKEDAAPDHEVKPEKVSPHILRIIAKAPVNLLLLLVAVLWLVPTIGLALTSLMSANDFATTGWWKVISHPHLATWDNYSTLINDTSIPSSLWVTIQIAVGGTILPIMIAALAGYAFAWLEFPGRDWLFIIVIAMLVVPIQMALIPIFSLYNHLHLFDTVSGLSFSNPASDCHSRSSSCATSSSGYRRTSSNRRASTAHPRSGSSCA